MFTDPSRVEIVYESVETVYESSEFHFVPVTDLENTVIDPYDGEDMNIVGVKIHTEEKILKAYTGILERRIREGRTGNLEEFLKNFLRDSLR